ncbi:MAG: hypothetical protein V4439_04375 [Patescibacteria group bacterium]
MNIKIKLFKTKNKFSHSRWSKISPSQNWRLALYILLAIFIASFSFGFYLFIQNNKDINADVANTQASKDMLNSKRIQKILDMFSMREKNSANILSNPSTILDPSI